ncbi:MAG: hypothetical protein ACR2MZ_10470 [Candidatus Dormibacter sp.]
MHSVLQDVLAGRAKLSLPGRLPTYSGTTSLFEYDERGLVRRG